MHSPHRYEEILSLLETLIAFRSVTDDHAANREVLEWVADRLPASWHMRWHESGNHPSFVATAQDTKTPALLLAAHSDVVPGSDRVFIPRREGGNVVGRGAFDMKFAIACFLTLIAELGDETDRINLGLAITSDEEHGGRHGTKVLLEDGYRPGFVFLPDGGENWRVQSAAKGLLSLRVDAHGTCAHGSRPWEGISATEILMRFLREVSLDFVKEPCGDSEHRHDTICIGRIDGGEAINQVPGHAHALLDVRFISQNASDSFMQRLEERTTRCPEVTCHTIRQEAWYETDLDHPLIHRWRMIAREIADKDPEPILAHGGSDANFYGAYNIPVLLVRPRGGNQHAEDEWIDADDLGRFYEVLRRFVKEFTPSR